MSMDENPDEVFENEPETEAEMEENGDEQSNRSFRMLMIGLFAFGGLGVLLIALILIGRQGERAAVEAQNQLVQATNTAIAMLAQATPVPPSPTDTSVPTRTPTPTTPTPTATAAPKDLVDTVLSAGNFKTLSSLLKTAGLADALKGPGPFTIFAPTDDAFAQLSSATLDALNKDPQKLAALLKYHVVEGALQAPDVAKSSTPTTQEGQTITITVKDDTTQINGATLSRPGLETANGVIYTIDRVLVPPELSKEVAFVAPATSAPGATPGKGTAIAQVQGTAAVATTVVPTRVPPQAATATAAASKGITSTQPISGTAGTGGTGLPTTGAGDNLFVLLLAAVGLVGVLVVARRLRTSQG